MQLRVSPSVPARAQRQLRKIVANAPVFLDTPIQITFRHSLTAHAGRLLSGDPERGRAVHAAAFLRRRCIVLERELLRNTPKLKLIFTHELFHFAWLRLGNARRREFSELLALEHRARARGELGESSVMEKGRLRTKLAPPVWRSYVCESFCDTAAWLYAGVSGHAEFQLAEKWRVRRKNWFEAVFKERRPA